MELTTLKATSRVLGANRDNARLRKAGQIPAVYYGKGMEALNIAVSEIDVRKVLAPGKRYTLLDLEIDGKAGNPAVIYTYQKDAITQKITHIDFLKIAEDSMVKVRVPVKLNGLPVGVKTQGGVFSKEARYLVLAAKPACIPTVLEMDISDFGLHPDGPRNGYLRFRYQHHVLCQGLQAPGRCGTGLWSAYRDLHDFFQVQEEGRHRCRCC